MTEIFMHNFNDTILVSSKFDIIRRQLLLSFLLRTILSKYLSGRQHYQFSYNSTVMYAEKQASETQSSSWYTRDISHMYIIKDPTNINIFQSRIRSLLMTSEIVSPRWKYQEEKFIETRTYYCIIVISIMARSLEKNVLCLQQEFRSYTTGRRKHSRMPLFACKTF